MIDRFMAFTSAIAAMYKAIQKIERQETDRYGLRGPHVRCLVEIGQHPEGLPAARLCELCGKDKAAVSRSLAVLEKKGLIHRETGYRGLLTLTPKGNLITGELEKTARRFVEAASLDLSEEERQKFYENMNLISGSLQEMSMEGAKEE